MKLLITAGPTREPIDPVRYISNRSSGKMGYALAEAAVHSGAYQQVILISGPVKLSPPNNVQFIAIESAAEMYQAVEQHINHCTAAIFCAAVSDYRVATIAQQKIKKSEQTLTIELEKTEDILGSCRNQFDYQGTLVGFAAETENLATNATKKLQRKGCDLLIANDVSRSDIGFNSDNNQVTIFSETQPPEPLPMQSKTDLAKHIISLVQTVER